MLFPQVVVTHLWLGLDCFSKAQCTSAAHLLSAGFSIGQALGSLSLNFLNVTYMVPCYSICYSVSHSDLLKERPEIPDFASYQLQIQCILNIHQNVTKTQGVWLEHSPAHGDTQGQSPSCQGGQAVSLWPCTCSWLQLHKGKKKRIVRVFMLQIRKESLRGGVKSQKCAPSEVFSNLSHSVRTFGNWKWKEIVQIIFRCLC